MTTNTDKPVVYGASWCIPCTNLKVWLDKNHIPYKYIDVETIKGGQDELDRNNISSIPTLVVGNVRLYSPTDAELSTQFLHEV